MATINKELCVEFARLENLELHHWTLLTGIGAGKDDSFIYCKEGVFPVQYSEQELGNLTPVEQYIIGEISNLAPLEFPCSPTRLLQFVDHVSLGDFSVPDDFREVLEQKADAEFTGSFDEVRVNGRSIDWHYWMSMKTLTASQSSRLMVGLDPDIFTSLDHNGPTRNDTSGQRDRAKKIERLALNHGMAEGTASEWLSWAKSNGFSIHRLFAIEVEDKGADDEMMAGVAAVNRKATSCKESSSDAPESSEVIDTTGMVAWQAAILENWQAVTSSHGNAITARQVMAWCRALGPRDVFGCEQTNTRESIRWIDRTSGDIHTVTLARIGTVLSEWRKEGKVPPRK